MRGLRITEVERIVVRVPFQERCRPWNEILVGQWGISEIIRVRTDDPDVVGYGETLLHYSWGSVSDAAIAEVRGGNPADFLGRDDLGPGLQMALYDAVARSLEVPIHRLFPLPQIRDRMPLSWWNTKMAPEVLAEEAAEAFASGYTSHKFKARPWFDVYEQVERISAVTPEYYTLDLDWNQMLLDVGTAAPVFAELDRNPRMGIYETPIRHLDLEGNRRLRDKAAHPIADHFHESSFPARVRAEAVDGFVLTGGAATVIEQGTLAHGFGKPFWLQLVGTGITTAFTAQLAAVLPGARWPSVTCLNIYADDLVTDEITVHDGHVAIPDSPGLGVEIDLEALERFAMKPPYRIDFPDSVLTVSWPGNRVRHYATIGQLWDDCLAGNVPAQERGARLEVWNDDGSGEFRELRARALSGPVSSRG
ncbi:MAG TPA: enolase C-terminal domain-like protein [Mycobacteriales bacterium]|nr:enolase C-terminal domain-like protein [Mycobacteriales bacterium]